MDYARYIYPELLVLVPMLIILGCMIKGISFISNKWIPLVLGGIGVIIATAYIVGADTWSVSAVVGGAIQGVLCAGAAVYSHQLVKQIGEK